jgi:hypothetical protein
VTRAFIALHAIPEIQVFSSKLHFSHCNDEIKNQDQELHFWFSAGKSGRFGLTLPMLLLLFFLALPFLIMLLVLRLFLLLFLLLLLLLLLPLLLFMLLPLLMLLLLFTVKFHFVTIKHVVMFFKLQISY